MARRYSLSPPISAAAAASLPAVRRDGADRSDGSREGADGGAGDRNDRRAGTSEAEHLSSAPALLADAGTADAAPAAPKHAPVSAGRKRITSGRAPAAAGDPPAAARRPVLASVSPPDTPERIGAIEFPDTPGPDVPGPPPPASLPVPPPYPRPVNEADWDLSPLAGIEVIYSYKVAVESDAHQIQRELLFAVISGLDDQPGYVGADRMVYYSPKHAAEVFENPESLKTYNKAPDYFYVVNGRHLPELRKSWNVWQEKGLLPDIIIEVTSSSTKRVDYSYKRYVYGRIFRTSEYYIYEPGAETFLALRLRDELDDSGIEPDDSGIEPDDSGIEPDDSGIEPDNGGYYEYTERVNGRVWSPVHKLWLGIWDGWPLGYKPADAPHRCWLRFYDSAEAQAPIPTGNERAELQRVRAEQEHLLREQAQDRADVAEQRAEQERLLREQAQQIADNLAQSLRGALLALLQGRFGALDAPLVQRVEQAPTDALQRWLARAGQAGELAEVFE